MTNPAAINLNNRAFVELDSSEDLTESLTRLITDNKNKPKRVDLVDHDYLISDDINIPSGWRVVGCGDGQVHAPTTIKGKGCFLIGRLSEATRNAELSQFRMIVEDDSPGIRLKKCRESDFRDITLVKNTHLKMGRPEQELKTGRAIEMLGGDKHGVYINTFNRVETVGFDTGFYIEGDLTVSGRNKQRCNGNKLIDCRTDSGKKGISISGTAHIDIAFHHAERNEVNIHQRKPLGSCYSLRTNVIGGYLEKSKNGIDVDWSNSSTGRAGTMRLYGTRIGLSIDPNNQITIHS